MTDTSGMSFLASPGMTNTAGTVNAGRPTKEADVAIRPPPPCRRPSICQSYLKSVLSFKLIAERSDILPSVPFAPYQSLSQSVSEESQLSNTLLSLSELDSL